MANIAIDSYDKLYVRNENTGSPTTFLDSSTANVKTITANGNAKQLPVKFNKSAGFFNGTTDKVSIADSADWTPSGDFTLEAFINMTTVQACGIIGHAQDGSNFCEYLDYDGTNIVFRHAAGGAYTIDHAWAYTFTANTWYHLALVRTGSSWVLWVDGVAQATKTSATAITNFTGTLDIGYRVGHGNYFAGWIKELRFSHTARTITVPTSQYSSDSNTKLLLHFDTPASSPIAPAIYFDGTGDYLTIPDSADFDMTDWTIEYFSMFDGAVGVWGSNRMWSVGDYNSGGMAFITSSGNMDLYLNNTAHNFGAFAYVANKWYHFRFVKTGSTIRMFIDGRQHGADKSQTYTLNPASVVTVGCWTGQSDSYFKGHLREFRISNSARDSAAAFTPSQTGFAVDSNTKLYIKGNEANGVTTFVDSETTPKTVTTNGDTKIKYTEDYRSCIFKDDGNTGHKPYPVSTAKVDFFAMSTGVGYFDGTGDYLSVPDDADWDVGTGDFCLEGYARPDGNLGAASTLVEIGNAGTVGTRITYNGSGAFLGIINGSAIVTATLTPITNIWYHVALVRYSGTLYVYINGSLVNSAADSTDITGSTAGARVGSDQSNQAFKGLLDNIRIAKGVARYTATFDPPFDDVAAAGRNQIIWMD